MAVSDRNDLKHRLGAILAADVAGYSQLMAADDRATVVSLDLARAIFRTHIENHGGRVVDMAGDSVLAFFETAVGAVSAAITVQQSIADTEEMKIGGESMQFRIGVHLGDIIEKPDGSIYGDGVNIAARLEGLSHRGSVAVSDAVYGAVRGRIAEVFVDQGEQSVKNIPYPVRMYFVQIAGNGNNSSACIELQHVAPVSIPPTDKPSIAVLPFKVLSRNDPIELLADGLAEDVTALLARVPGFMLISRASTLGLNLATEGVSEIAKKLGVRYLVEGSVRPFSESVRVSTQLVDAASGEVLWSGRFDSQQSKVEDLQDAIARGIMSQLEPELTRAEIALIKRQRPENVDAWGCYRQAIGAVAGRGWTESTIQEARQYFQRALDIDPDFHLARANLSLMTAAGMQVGLLAHSKALVEQARMHAETAISSDFGSAEVLGYAGCALSDLGDHRRGLEVLTRALEIDPSNAQAHVAYGASCVLSGQTEKGIESMRYGIRISPRDRRLGFWVWVLGAFLLRANLPEQALVEARTSASRDATLHLAHVLESATLLALREPDSARVALQAAMRIRPSLTLRDVSRTHGTAAANAMAQIWPSEPRISGS